MISKNKPITLNFILLIIVVFLVGYLIVLKNGQYSNNYYNKSLCNEIIDKYGELSLINMSRKKEMDKEFMRVILVNDTTKYFSLMSFYRFSHDPDLGFYYLFLMATRNKNPRAFKDLSAHIKNYNIDNISQLNNWSALFSEISNYHEAKKSMTEKEINKSREKLITILTNLID